MVYIWQRAKYQVIKSYFCVFSVKKQQKSDKKRQKK